MNLKRGLEGKIRAELAEFECGANEARKALRALRKEDLNDADYDIELRVLWAGEGYKPVTVEYHGSLRDAIKEAEDRFKAINRRDDVQANYSVFIRLAGIRYEIPPKYWEKSKGKI
jgi:hypothetical protein